MLAQKDKALNEEMEKDMSIGGSQYGRESENQNNKLTETNKKKKGGLGKAIKGLFTKNKKVNNSNNSKNDKSFDTRSSLGFTLGESGIRAS